MEDRIKLQVVVAHPDDETFGCGSILLHAAAAGATTSVVCATRGEAGGTAADLGEIRERELREAASLLGVGEVRLLGFGDSDMSGAPAPGTLCAAPYDEVLAAVRDGMAAFGPDVVVTLDASDGHRDHARMRDAAIEAARDLGVPRVYLACLPRSLMRRWADEMRRINPDMEHLNADTAGLGTPDDEVTTLVDVTGHLPAREAAMRVHASQTSPYEGLSDDLRRAFLGTAALRRVVPKWEGGAPETSFLPVTAACR